MLFIDQAVGEGEKTAPHKNKTFKPHTKLYWNFQPQILLLDVHIHQVSVIKHNIVHLQADQSLNRLRLKPEEQPFAPAAYCIYFFSPTILQKQTNNWQTAGCSCSWKFFTLFWLAVRIGQRSACAESQVVMLPLQQAKTPVLRPYCI